MIFKNPAGLVLFRVPQCCEIEQSNIQVDMALTQEAQYNSLFPRNSCWLANKGKSLNSYFHFYSVSHGSFHTLTIIVPIFHMYFSWQSTSGKGNLLGSNQCLTSSSKYHVSAPIITSKPEYTATTLAYRDFSTTAIKLGV